MSYINEQDWQQLGQEFVQGRPFNHCVIDDFFTEDTVRRLLAEFPVDYDSTTWNAIYDNPVEHKRTCNQWDRFPKTTYQVFQYLNSQEFVEKIETITRTRDIIGDVGLHGGGWHAHTRGGRLNVHLDYSIHPKLRLARKYNLIVYLTPKWQSSWGGGLGLWTHNAETNQPQECLQVVENVYNRAVLFDTTQNSWHGLPDPLQCPADTMRRSLAVYYLSNPVATTASRPRALFAPYQEQAQDPEIVEFVKKRSQID